MSRFPSGDLQVVTRGGDRLLFNHRDVALSRIRVAELLVSSEGPSGPLVFQIPVYEIEEIPPHAYTDLPSRDENLDGYVLWHVREAEWEDGKTLTEPIKLSERKIWGGATSPETRVGREVVQVDTEPERPAIPTGSQ